MLSSNMVISDYISSIKWWVMSPCPSFIYSLKHQRISASWLSPQIPSLDDPAPWGGFCGKGSRHVLGRDVTDAYRLKHRCPPVHTKHRQYGSHPLHLTASDQNIRNFKDILLLPKSSWLLAVLFTWKISGYKTTYYPLEQRFFNVI